MYLRQLDLRSAPGLPRAIALTELRPGLVLLLGPNASGKSTIGRAIRGTLWPSSAPSGVDTLTTWSAPEDSTTWRATLVFGHVGWEGDPPRLPTELASSAWLSLQDLLRDDARTDLDIARSIQTQLDGGYDLSAIGPRTAPRVRPLPTVRDPYRQAVQHLREQLDATAALAEREAKIASLEEERERAADAPQEIVRLQRARRGCEITSRLGSLQRELDALPDGIERLPPNALQTAEDHAAQVERARDEVKRREETLEQTSEAAEALAFPGRPPEPGSVKVLVERAEALVDEARTLRQDEATLAGLAARRDEAARQIWAQGTPTTLPDLHTLESLSTQVAALAASRARLQALPQVAEIPAPPASEPDKLQRARVLLQQWLTARRPLAPHTPTSLSTILALAGLLLLGLGLVLVVMGLHSIATDLTPWALAGLGALSLGLGGVLLGLAAGLRWGHRISRAPASEAQGIANELRRTGFTPLPTWTTEGVRQAVDAIDEQLREHERKRQAADEAQRQRDARTRVQLEVSQQQARLHGVASSLGLAPDLPDLALPVQASRLLALAQARAAWAEARAQFEKAATALLADQEVVRQAVDAVGLDTLPPHEDATGLLSAARAIDERLRDWRHAEERCQQAKDELRRDREALGQALSRRDAHLAACGVSPDELDPLAALTDQREQWEALTVESRALHTERDGLALSADLPDSAPAIDEAIARQTALAERLTELSQTLAEIHREVEQATKGRDITQTIAAREAALDQLAADRDAHLQGHASVALVEWLRTRRSHGDAPALLARARAWFLRFTGNRYELQVRPEGGFVALDTHTDQLQALSALSDGTRVQLLLAARLAFVEHVEGTGERAPLFLDEVLSTTDDQRFHAVAAAVLELAADGRQVFYATASAAEARAWARAARGTDHPAPQVRTLGTSPTDWSPPPDLPTTRAPLPDPKGLDAIEYAEALGLRRPHLHTPADAWPLALALHDHLPTAHRAAERGLLHLGQLDLARDGVALPLDDGELTLAQARRQVIAATLDALRVGRGLPVTWQAVQDSGAVTSKFADPVRALLAVHSDDAPAFVQAVGELPRFHRSQLARLRDHLEEINVLDTREALSEDEVLTRTMRACADATRTIDLRETEALVRFVREVVADRST